MSNVPYSVIEELKSHVIDRINDGVLTDDNKDEWHFYCFNGDYYIVYHSLAREWLKKHSLDAFEAIDYVVEQHDEHFGDKFDRQIDPETVVNLYVYFAGYELDLDHETVEDLREAMEGES